MAFKAFKVLKGLLIKEENTNLAKQIEITPGGTANTKTSVVSSQTTDKTLTLPDATDTLIGKATTDILTNKSFDADGVGNSITNIENADIKAAAGIAYAKLNLSNSIVNADVSTIAAIDATKIANGVVSNAEFQQLDGLTSPAVGTTQAQAITTKTIVVANNTITTAVSGNLVATELNAALAELQTDIDTRASRSLNNLTSPTAINQNLVPDLHNTRAVGDNNFKFNAGWFDSSIKSPIYDVVASGAGSVTSTGSLNAVGTAPDGTSVGAAITNNGTNSVGLLTNTDTNIDAVATSNILIATGNKTAGTGNSGSIKIRPGTSAGGIRGKILLEDGSLTGSSTGHVWTLDNTATGESSWKASSGGGSSSLITNGTADNTATSIFTPYADAVLTRPVDGTGGAPTVTTSITSTTPLTGTKSFLLTKPASNTQGQGWSVPFTVDPAYRAKSLKISMDYIVNSGTFAPGTPTVDSDTIIYIYDVTNSILIEPSSIKFLASSTTISDKIEATFQTSVSGSSYRLIVHCATASLLAYELKVDNVIVSPQTYVFGTPETDWQAVTVTGSWVTNTTYTAKRRRMGDSYQYDIHLALTGAPTATTLSINLPSGDVIDTTDLASGTNTSFNSSINGKTNIIIGSAFTGGVNYTSTTSVSPTFFDTNGNGGGITNISPGTFANGSFVGVVFTVPIVGLSSSVQMSDQADTRVIDATGLGNPNNTITGTFSKATWATTPITKDTHGAWDTVNNYYKIIVAGDYRTKFSTEINQTTVLGSVVACNITHRNSAGTILLQVAGFDRAFGAGTTSQNATTSHLFVCNSGDTLEFQTSATGTAPTYSGSLSGSIFDIARISGPQAIAASEKIKSIVYQNSGQSIVNSTITTVLANVTEYDSHNAYNTSTGEWTQPRAGSGLISGHISLNMTPATTSTIYVYVFKNGSQIGRELFTVANIANIYSMPFSVGIFGISGDKWTIRVEQNSGANRALSNTSPDNVMSFILD